jgi:copper oxidase (laccase) domain-containing protein
VIYIYAVHLSGGTRHEHIASVRWKNPDTGNTGQSNQSEMVDWVKNKDGHAYVCGNGHLARVRVVEASPPYIRTHADGVWTDNLLALPRY